MLSGNSAICHRPFGFSCSNSIAPTFPRKGRPLRSSRDDRLHCARFFLSLRGQPLPAVGLSIVRRMHLLSETVYARDLMSYGATDFDAGGCRARGPTLVAAMAMLTALLLGGCMPATLSPVSDANFTARDKQQLTN